VRPRATIPTDDDMPTITEPNGRNVFRNFPAKYSNAERKLRALKSLERQSLFDALIVAEQTTLAQRTRGRESMLKRARALESIQTDLLVLATLIPNDRKTAAARASDKPGRTSIETALTWAGTFLLTNPNGTGEQFRRWIERKEKRFVSKRRAEQILQARRAHTNKLRNTVS
jgi:hypothetical protein